MTEIRNSKPVLVIEYWNLQFICDLVLGVWDFYHSWAIKITLTRKLALGIVSANHVHGQD
jgi:hypothetical protein